MLLNYTAFFLNKQVSRCRIEFDKKVKQGNAFAMNQHF